MNLVSINFDTIITIETIKSILDLQKEYEEFYRVLTFVGELTITRQNGFFPFENDEIRIGNKEFSTRIRLLPYIPFLHESRVLIIKSLTRIFIAIGYVKKKDD